MDLLNKAKLFGNFSLVYGKTHKVLTKASEYLPKDFSALISVMEPKETKVKAREILAEDFVLNSFYKPLSQKLEMAEFDSWKICMKAAVISKSVNAWLGHKDFQKCFLAALVRDLPIMILRLEDKENYKAFELRVIEGKSIAEASLLSFGIGLEQYLEQFYKHFNYGMINENQEKIVDFSYYLAESFSNKEQKASKLWIESQQEMEKLGLVMDEDKWANYISILFVKTLETEAKFK